MAKRLIEADKFLQWVVKRFKCVPLVGSCYNDEESMSLLLAQAPTVDAVEVCYCKDCQHCREYSPQKGFGYCYHWSGDQGLSLPEVEGTDFCSYGERKEG